MSSTNQQTASWPSTQHVRRRERSRRSQTRLTTRAVLLSLLSAPAAVSAQSQCVSLQGSKACPAWQDASISSDTTVVGTFSFLRFVTDLESFDRELDQYIKTAYISEKYQAQWGCGAVDFTQASDFYARFTRTTICSAIIQMSKATCSVSEANARPVCAETCAQFAQSEAFVSANPELCPNPGPELVKLIRADFATCSLPEEALSPSSCIQGVANEPDNCGFGDSTIGLCAYCSAGGINSTDTCCYNSNIDDRCAGVELPSITATMTFTIPSATATPGQQDDDKDNEGGLSGGAIAGIVIGSVVGALIIAGMIYLCFMLAKRRRGSSQSGSIFNQPSPVRKGPSMGQASHPIAPQGYEVLPGGRIARMSALEGHSGESPSRTNLGAVAASAGVGGGLIAARRRGDNHSSSDEFGDSPESDTRAGVLRPPPTTVKRNGSLSSGSHLGGEDAQSPSSAGGMSSPQGIASQQSEQLPFFKDYYSADDIHPGDRVAVLWAYRPRAADEFTLERGDMLKVVGIWDDGWATGIMLDERAEEWEARRQAQRDSGVSNTSGRRDTSPPVSGEIKAFPLVCVCLPEHWRKTIDGDGSTETGSSAHQGAASAVS